MALAETKHTHTIISESTQLAREIVLNYPAQGTGQHQRIGSKLTVTGVRARLTFRARNAQGLMRVVLFRPRDPTKSLQADSIGVFSHIDKDEYVVYHDSLHPLSNGNGPDWATIDIGKKFPNGMITTFDDGTITIQDNALKLYITGWNTLTPDEHSVDVSCFYKDV